MLKPITIQQLTDASQDATSLSEFMFQPADYLVPRRLSPEIHTLNHYLSYFEALKSVFTQPTGDVVVDGVAVPSMLQKVAEVNAAVNSVQTALSTVASDAVVAVNNAINNTAIEGGVLADTFVVVDGTLSQRTINKGLESIANLSTINNPKDGLRVYVKSYYAGLGMGGGGFIYDSTKSTINNGGTIISGWVRETDGVDVKPEWFGVRTDGVDDPTKPNHELMQVAVDNGFKSFDFGGAEKNYLFNGQVGLGAQTFYRTNPYVISGSGAVIKLEGTHAWLTTKTVKDLGGAVGVGNTHTGKVFINGLAFTGRVRDGIFDGDYLYNVMFTGNDCYEMNLIARSYKNKSATYPNGYFQSLTLRGNNFSKVNKILDGSRGFNITVDGNTFEGCEAGIYIFGNGQPALAVIRVINNVFEGGGLFLKLSDAIGGVVANNYLESNSLGDAAIEKCGILITRSGGSSLCNYSIDNNLLGVTNAQISDDDYECVKLVGFLTGNVGNVSFNGNYSSGIITKSSSKNAHNNIQKISPLITMNGSAGESFVSYNKAASLLELGTVAADGEVKLFWFDTVPNSIIFRDTRLNVVLNCVVTNSAGTDLTRFSVSMDVFVHTIFRSGGTNMPASLGVVLGEASIIQQPSTTVVNVPANLKVPPLFTEPTFRIDSVGNRHTLVLTGYAPVTVPSYGTLSKIDVLSTITSYNFSRHFIASSNFITYFPSP